MTGAEIIAGAQADGLVLSVEDGLLSIAGSAATSQSAGLSPTTSGAKPATCMVDTPSLIASTMPV